MADITLLPRHHYLSLPIGASGYNGTSGVIMPATGYDDVTGIYTTSASPSLVFNNNATKFNIEQASYWYYIPTGYNWGNLNLRFPSGMSNKAFNLSPAAFFEASSDIPNYLDFFFSPSKKTEVTISDPPGTKLLWGIMPFFGRASSEPSSFRYAALVISSKLGSHLGDCPLSIASEVIEYKDIGISGNPKTVKTYSDGSTETYEFNFETGVETQTFETPDAPDDPIVFQTQRSTSFVAKSELTTYPIGLNNYFYDAYSSVAGLSGYYANEAEFNAAVAARNAEAVGFQLTEVTPGIFPSKQRRSIGLNGALYYQTYDPFLPSDSQHRFE